MIFIDGVVLIDPEFVKDGKKGKQCYSVLYCFPVIIPDQHCHKVSKKWALYFQMGIHILDQCIIHIYFG